MQAPPTGSGERVLHCRAHAPTSYLSRNAKPMYCKLQLSCFSPRNTSGTYSWCNICPVCGPKDELVTIWRGGVHQRRQCVTATLLNISDRSRRWQGLLTTPICFFVGGMNICVRDTFQIGMFAKDIIQQFVVELVIKIHKHFHRDQFLRTGSKSQQDVPQYSVTSQ